MVYTTYLNEEILNDEIYPVFIAFSEAKTAISRKIKSFTRCPYSHCMISLDPELKYFYSFNIIDKYNDGFVIETLERLKQKTNNICIYVFFVNKQTYKSIVKNIKYYNDFKDKTKYNFKKLFDIVLNKDKENKNPLQQICSSFVYAILSSAGIKLAQDKIITVKPSDIYNTINNNKKYIYLLYEGSTIDLDIDDIAIKLNKIKNKKSTKEYNQEKIVLTESISPESVDRSEYDNFKLFDLFHVYTTDKTLRDDPTFIAKMKWVKDRITEICDMAGWTVYPYELTLCASFDDLDEFYNHQAPKWVTGFTYGDKVYMKAPSIYPGELYYNVVLHECIHVQIYLNEKLQGRNISREDEEGMAVFFSTPLDKWLKELNHGPNWYYYESAIRVQEDFLNYGMKKVIQKRFK